MMPICCVGAAMMGFDMLACLALCDFVEVGMDGWMMGWWIWE